MSSYLFPVLLLAAAAAATYLCCIRPMRRDGSCHPGAARAGVRLADPDIDAEIRRLREEVYLLRRQLDPNPAQPTPGGRDGERR